MNWIKERRDIFEIDPTELLLRYISFLSPGLFYLSSFKKKL